jgi:hypothetical protein
MKSQAARLRNRRAAASDQDFDTAPANGRISTLPPAKRPGHPFANSAAAASDSAWTTE